MHKNNQINGMRSAAVIILLALTLAACQPAAAPEATATLPAATLPAAALPTDDQAAPVADATAASAGALTPAGPAAPVVTPTPYILKGSTTTDSGLQYLELTPGKGESPNLGDVITMQFIVSLPDGTELANTYTEGREVNAVWRPGNLMPGWEEGLGLMNAGGKAKLVIPSELAFGEQGSGGIPAGTPIIVELELLAVEEPPAPTAFEDEKLTKTESGLAYYDLVEGSGAEASKNSTVSTDYAVWVKTEAGYDFIEKSQAGQPAQFVVGRGGVVFPGWEEGATGMKLGGKRLLVIPAELAMGAEGGGPIPPNAVLLMEIELTELREPLVATKVVEKDYTTTASGLKYYDLTVGTGAAPAAGQILSVHYTGWLEDGTQFDSSVEGGTPLQVELGAGRVIAGWDEGLATMKVGGKRQLKIPADLAYGPEGAGDGVIPPDATLIFEVELLGIETQP